MDASIENLPSDLPDADSASRFMHQFSELHPSKAAKLMRSPGLLADVLTLVSYSPLIAATLLQNPDYITWLGAKRGETSLRTKDELLESLAQFSLMHSQLETQVLLARFRRRELIRIFLRDIRRLATVAEITEEISNLADAVLEFALRSARQTLDNRYGSPLETDEKGRSKPAEVCIVALGKLGSKELNYSSDIDLVFIYSSDGETAGLGPRGSVTNREYFVKLAELIVKLIGEKTGEGAAYRVDLRLRPHGRIGALAMSLPDTVRYYMTEAQSWERQVLIRSRASAGELTIFREFVLHLEDRIFSPNESIAAALAGVSSSKQKINVEHISDKGWDVKLGRGGIREIEFVAQALQLAYGGRDRWLRAPHTLISLSRLADRGLLTEKELTELFGAYEFFRHLEHLLQMEHGLQTHLLPYDPEKRQMISRRMRFAEIAEFESVLETHIANVSAVYHRIFDGAEDEILSIAAKAASEPKDADAAADARLRRREPAADIPPYLQASLERASIEPTPAAVQVIERMSRITPHFTEMIAANPILVPSLSRHEGLAEHDYPAIINAAVAAEADFRGKLSALRKTWSRLLIEIVVLDVFEELPLTSIKTRQTRLAEASIDTAFRITLGELSRRYAVAIDTLPFAILGLGKIGGAGIDYDSDLDLVLAYDDSKQLPVTDVTHAEFYGRAAEIFVSVLSDMTRDGKLYRVDLRLRPHGKDGATAISGEAFAEYMRSKAAVWELLAFVKVRAVGGDIKLAKRVEDRIRSIIHDRAVSISDEELRRETRRVRLLLQEQRSRGRKGKDIDIKYGSGGMLDVYFAMRYLQLRDSVPDDPENRSSAHMLKRLVDNRSLSFEQFEAMIEAYRFLSTLDHNLRLTVGRTTRLPIANRETLNKIAERMGLSSEAELIEHLTMQRIAIREVFDEITNP